MFLTLLSHCLSSSDYKLNWFIYQYDPLLEFTKLPTYEKLINKLEFVPIFKEEQIFQVAAQKEGRNTVK